MTALIDTVEILRAEMNCLKHVEVRTSADLATPATIGWKRLLILLPEDWRTWTDDERRAVLAHELAHVCRGDFFTGLLAQLSLALQFYHPLAHWLAARLRLEQELAADAWSARLSGGNHPLSHNAGSDGSPPRCPVPVLACPCVSPVPWNFCPEDRDAPQFQACPSCRALRESAIRDRGVPCLPWPAGRRPAGADGRPPSPAQAAGGIAPGAPVRRLPRREGIVRPGLPSGGDQDVPRRPALAACCPGRKCSRS